MSAEVRTLTSPGRPVSGQQGSASPLAFASRSFFDALYFGTRFLIVASAASVCVVVLVLLVLRFIDPPTSSVMMQHRLSGQAVQQTWVPLAKISPNLQRAVIASEDAKFCRHHGLDLGELAYVMRQAHRNSSFDVRGASTITMQVTRNLFLWQGKSLIRKALEISIAPLMDLIWPKRRILEVYLNIAEWAPGRFGAEAAAIYHFGRPVSRLSQTQAALMAASLPNPRYRRPGTPNATLRRKSRRLIQRAKGLSSSMACIEKPTGRAS